MPGMEGLEEEEEGEPQWQDVEQAMEDLAEGEGEHALFQVVQALGGLKGGMDNRRLLDLAEGEAPV